MPSQDDNAAEKAPAARTGEQKPAPGRGRPPQRRGKPPERKREFKSFDASRSPDAMRMKDPSMKGRLKRSKDRRDKRRRRRTLMQIVLPTVVTILILIFAGVTLRNFYVRDSEAQGQTKTQTVPPAVAAPAPAPAAAAPEPVAGAPANPTAATNDPGTASPPLTVKEARDRFLMRTGGKVTIEGDGEVSDLSKDVLRSVGLDPDKADEAEAEEEISEEEKRRLLKKAAPFSRTVRENQRKREIEPEDLYLPGTETAE